MRTGCTAGTKRTILPVMTITTPDAARLAALVRHMSLGALIEDEHRRVLLTNQQFCQIFGIPVPPAALVGTDCAAAADAVKGLFLDPEHFVRANVQCLRNARPVSGQRFAMCDGRVLERDYAPIDDQGRFLGHLWTYRDITASARTADAGGSAMVGLVVEPTVLRQLTRLPGSEGRNLAVELVESFSARMPSLLDELRLLGAAGDAPGVIRAAHSLRGAALQLGAVLLADQARQLEVGARAGILDDHEVTLATIAAQWPTVAAAMWEACAPTPQEMPPAS